MSSPAPSSVCNEAGLLQKIVEPTALAMAWDLTLQHLTLGGALVLRQEAELLLRETHRSHVVLFVTGDDSCREHVDRVAEIVFASSAVRFEVVRATPPEDSWPQASERQHPDFSYFSFERLNAFHERTHLPVRLSWSEREATLALHTRSRFAGRLVCVHLRSVAPLLPDESNADGVVWNAFFSRHADPRSMNFLLIGDDPLPAGMMLRPGVTRAKDIGLELATQLTLVAHADGFLGMASGISAAANFSETPHVIFKHPAHHPAEMRRELGAADHFPFASSRQKLFRRVTDGTALDEALALIVP